MKTIAEHLADSFVFCMFSVQTEPLFFFLKYLDVSCRYGHEVELETQHQ